jgi:predicted RNA-binding protein with PUA-like domain
MKKFWLFKSEPNVFSIDKLIELPQSTSTWEGIRNYQARNYLRDEVSIGDEVFFYHSRIDPIGIVGTMEVIKKGYPDHFSFDKKSEYYDEKSKKENPTWFMVDVKFKNKFKNVITLSELKKQPILSKMIVLQKGSRLSIQPVTEIEFNFIMDNLST